MPHKSLKIGASQVRGLVGSPSNLAFLEPLRYGRQIPSFCLDYFHTSGLFVRLKGIARVNPKKRLPRPKNGHPRTASKTRQIENIREARNEQHRYGASLHPRSELVLPGGERMSR
jgi:hypothetical protein